MIINPITRFLVKRRLKKSGLTFTKEDQLKAKPIRNSLIKWDKSENNIVTLVVPQKKTLWVRVVSKVFMLPGSRVVVLDEVGSFVWALCDGNNSVDSIIRNLCNKYKLTRKEAEISLLSYFRILGRRGFVGFAVQKKAEQKTPPDLVIIPNSEEKKV